MQRLVYALLPCIFFLDFLRVYLKIPKVLLLLPELLSGVALLLVMSELAKTGRFQLAGRYVLLVCVLVITIVFGLVVSEATTGPIVGGLRLYLKYLVFFLLPIVFVLTERQLRLQMIAVLGLMLLQLPVTLLQRFVFHVGESGDSGRGTLGTGSITAVVVLFGLSVVIAMYHQGHLSRMRAFLMGACLALTPMFADAKGAFILLPLAIMIPTLFATVPGVNRVVRTLKGGVVVVAALAVFALAYSFAESTFAERSEKGYRTSIIDFYKDPALVLSYMAPQLAGHENPDRVGRLDGVIAPVVEFWGDPLKMISGLGFGALADSPFDFFAVDQYQYILDSKLGYVSISRILWELGYVGTFLVLLALFLVWRDARRLSRVRSLEGALALGLLAIIPIYFASMFWKNVITNNTIMYLFAYYSGVVVAAAYRMSDVSLPENVVVAQTMGRNDEAQLPAILSPAKANSML